MLPAIRLPTGQPRPFEIETETTSNGADNSFAEVLRGDRRVEQTRAIEIGARAELARGLGRSQPTSLGGNTTPPPRLCVFSIATSVVGGNIMWPGALNAARNSASVNSPPLPICVNCTPALAPPAPDLVPDHVRFVAEHDIVAGPRQDLERDLIGHRAARNEDRGLLAEQCRHAFLQQVDRRIFAVLVVADLGFGDRAPHARRRLRHGVGTKIDDFHGDPLAH